MTTFLLKLIGIITMTIDHVGYMMRFRIDADYFRAVGRIAFPIYAYLITVGCVKTGNIKKYLSRLALFAIISEIPFDLFSQNVPYYSSLGSPVFLSFFDQNIFFTLFFGALCIYLINVIKEIYKSAYTPDNLATPWKLLGNPTLYLYAGFIAIILLAAYYLRIDYGLPGVLMILALYLTSKHKPLQLFTLTLFMAYIYLIDGGMDIFYTKMFIGSLFTIPIIALYNNKPGPRPAWLKYTFYAYYPLHLIVLAIINFMLPNS